MSVRFIFMKKRDRWFSCLLIETEGLKEIKGLNGSMFALPKKNSKSDSTFSTYVTVYDLCPRPARSWARPGRPRHCTYNYSK